MPAARFIHSFSSPTSVLSTVQHSSTGADDDFQLTPSSYHIDLGTLVQLLPNTIRSSTSTNTSYNATSTSTSTQYEYSRDFGSIGTTCAINQNQNDLSNTCTDPIGALFRRLKVSKADLEPFCFIDNHKNYTRNLIATDDETFTLLLLCWNPGKYSPIHDHPCDGCWMRVCQGCVNEVRYKKKDTSSRPSPSPSSSSNERYETEREEKDDHCDISSSFACTMDTTFEQGQQTFIHDNLGYHKVGNPCNDTIAISMHLYSPPFSECKIWMDQMDASSSTTSRMCNYSEYGQRKSYNKMK